MAGEGERDRDMNNPIGGLWVRFRPSLMYHLSWFVSVNKEDGTLFAMSTTYSKRSFYEYKSVAEKQKRSILADKLLMICVIISMSVPVVVSMRRRVR